MFKGFLIALVFRAPLFILFNLWQWAVSGSAVALFIEQIVYFATLYFFLSLQRGFTPGATDFPVRDGAVYPWPWMPVLSIM